VLLLAPYAPHLAEELWQKLGHDKSLAYEPWPEFDASLLKEDVVTVVIQVNGKVRGKLEVPADIGREELGRLALANKAARDFIGDKTVKKVIIVPGRLVNIAIG
jgi:leucyl-tRNA synthetase